MIPLKDLFTRMARAAVRCRNACDKAQDEPAVRYWMGYLDALEEIQSVQIAHPIADGGLVLRFVASVSATHSCARHSSE